MFHWKKTMYKSICVSFAVVIAITILQRSTTPDQYTVENAEEDEDDENDYFPLVSIRHLKRDLYAAPDSFWEVNLQTAVSQTSNSTEKLHKTVWDVITSNCTVNNSFTNLDWFAGLGDNFQQFLLYRHCRYFPIIINHPEKCAEDIYLLIVVKSIITQHDRREAIRRTWGKAREVDGKKIRTLFLLGTAVKEEERANYQKLLDYEDYIYHDILQWDFLDSFFNLTLKEVHFLKWFDTYCTNVKYIFKGDDDVFVSPDNILEYLDGKKVPDLFVGDILYKAKPIRKTENKYYIPEALYNKTHYPPYAGGGGFLMDSGLARKLYVACETLDLYPIDDVFLGMCLQVLKVQPIRHLGFKTFGLVKNKDSKLNKEPCFFKSMLVVHKLLPSELLNMSELVKHNLNCSKKYEVV
ncbi:UDP-GlcNAc:betaGal beta-1,3-N-acetylglucosaminyltransferase 7 [Protopterus annectens]|uniref:UDP-GlcNAc:betaGal beta-1,3-N-acetylglucosaminyltransferase 7 n=1 Tax=Protopterus annectens TaxID=7888 RepID=UPI001CFA5B83|nr:UDP-GlcNAc:betaGal beta-1,3-N-acetylglucosaminyltransferase 7 [Protopterus annectens]